ncbi:site-specific integrase [Rhodococcus sp. X156]|uniref:tyrosine-type recombinase/integrase n=1 Tax=Rhodococcus sp. X156 TaxID=2499145 RepID=UPI000FDAF51A|nr:site-specific integrase [Rhodococcus sp. X156]
MAGDKRGFGQIARLPSKRYRARYTGPDGLLHNAPVTYETRGDAEAWLVGERRKISRDEWTPPRKLSDAPRELTFGGYAGRWLQHRDLKPRTRAHYRNLLDNLILPTFAERPLKAITSESVRDWYADLDKKTPTLRSHSYGLLRTILATAVTDEKIPLNPCHIRGAGTTARVKKVEPATLTELATIAQEVPERYRLMVMFASWCALRFGELVELRRKDIDLNNGVIHVRRGAVRAEGKVIIGPPKSEAGVRDVAIPPHLMPMVREHLRKNIAGGKDGLLFPAADGTSTMAPATLYKVFYRARKIAGRDDLRWHDLRHTGAVLAAQTGASLAELMGRLGHSTPQAAMRYQHAAKGRDAQIAAALSALASGTATV